eukprot:4089275-Prymnesium_polylepis.1
MKVLLDFDARLQHHQTAEDSVDVGKDAVRICAQRVAKGPQRLDAVVDEQDLEAITLELVCRGHQLAHVEHPGNLEPQQ